MSNTDHQTERMAGVKRKRKYEVKNRNKPSSEEFRERKRLQQQRFRDRQKQRIADLEEEVEDLKQRLQKSEETISLLQQNKSSQPEKRSNDGSFFTEQKREEFEGFERLFAFGKEKVSDMLNSQWSLESRASYGNMGSKRVKHIKNCFREIIVNTLPSTKMIPIKNSFSPPRLSDKQYQDLLISRPEERALLISTQNLNPSESDLFHLRGRFTLDERQKHLNVINDNDLVRTVEKLKEEFKHIIGIRNKVLEYLEDLERITSARIAKLGDADIFYKYTKQISMDIKDFSEKDCL